MTDDFESLLHLFACAVSDVQIDYEREYDLKEIFSLATAQQIDSIIFPVIDKIKDDVKIYKREIFPLWENKFYTMVSFSAKRDYYISKLLKSLDEKKIKYCILKGRSLSDLYKEPDSRISGDVDLWICNEEDMKIVLDILKNDGFEVAEDAGSSHQIECHHKIYGLIELHSDICDSVAKNIWFENKVVLSDNFILKKDNYGNEFYALSITDGAIFVTFHFIKHFLSHGCGCRQMIDMLLYLRHYQDSIDWNTFNTLFGKLRYLKFIDKCRQIGNLYFAMDFEVNTDIDKAICDKILTDMEDGGIFGQEEEFRKEFTTIYTKRRKGKKDNFEHVKYIIIRAVEFVINRKFNIFSIIKDFKSRNKMISGSSGKINERVDLFEKLGFFE